MKHVIVLAFVREIVMRDTLGVARTGEIKVNRFYVVLLFYYIFYFHIFQ